MARSPLYRPKGEHSFLRLVRVAWVFGALTLGLFAAIGGHDCLRLPFDQAVTAQNNDEVKLELGSELTGRSATATGERYRLDLAGGQFVRVVLQKEGDLHLLVACTAPNGEEIVHSPSRTYDALQISLIAESPGAYQLYVRSLENTVGLHYDIRVATPQGLSAENRLEAEAERFFAAAERLRAEWTEASFRSAIEKYTQALTLWESLAEPQQARKALAGIGDLHFFLNEYSEALKHFNKALASSQADRDVVAEVQALNKIGYVQASMGKNADARRNFESALALSGGLRKGVHGAGSLHGEAEARNNLGEVSYSSGDLKKALTHFKNALALWETVKDRNGQALAHLNIGYTHYDMGDAETAANEYRQALSLWEVLDERRGQALAQTALGGVYSLMGQRQLALEAHNHAMRDLRSMGDRQGEAAALNGLGRIYEESNKPETALADYQRAFMLYEQIGNREFAALAEFYVARVYRTMGRTDEALAHYRDCISRSHAISSRRIEAYALKDLATIYNAQGDTRRALAQYAQVLSLYREFGDRRGQAQTLNGFGQIFLNSGNAAKALSYYRQALLLNHAIGDRAGEAATRFQIARAARDDGLLDDALAEIRKSLAIVESLRVQIASYELRSSYFALMNEYYDFYVSLLMQLHQQNPGARFNEVALEASESARARSFLEILIDAKADIRQGVSPEILAKEHSLQQQLSAKGKYYLRLMNDKRTKAEAAALDHEMRELTTQYEELEGKIREQSPAYAALTQPHILQVSEIQQSLIDDDTILLEYVLGNSASYLWVISRTSFDSYELPARAKVEEAAETAHRLMISRQPVDGESEADYLRRVEQSDQQYWQEAGRLSEMLLGPALGKRSQHRLLIVADGKLQYVPFDALPFPSGTQPPQTSSTAEASEPVPLVSQYEVINLPSASTLSSLREGKTQPPRPDRVAAIFADPVFEPTDARVQLIQPRPESAGGETTATSQRLRDAGVGSGIQRLPSTLVEGQAILSAIPHSTGILLSGFDANRLQATSDELAHYQILHFATHGVINSEHPELSGIILSMVNQRGVPQDGFLQIHDICSLKLQSQLVVLSACDTALGPDVRGEGLIGLNRAFLYAGAKSTIASLWKVDDDATAKLMNHFYRALIKSNLPPGAALRTAKAEMWRQKRWRHPYYWAAFVLQGEYRERIRLEATAQQVPVKIIVSVVVLLTLLLGILIARDRRRSGTIE